MWVSVWVSMCVLWAFIRTSQLSREFIYCTHGSLSDSQVYIKPVYFHPPLRRILQLSADVRPSALLSCIWSLIHFKCNGPFFHGAACLLWSLSAHSQTYVDTYTYTIYIQWKTSYCLFDGTDRHACCLLSHPFNMHGFVTGTFSCTLQRVSHAYYWE